MKFNKAALMIFTIVFTLFFSPLHAQKKPGLEKTLKATYNLVPQHSKDTQYYEMRTKLNKHASDGKIKDTEIYHLYLRCVPSNNPLQADEYTCLKFGVQINGTAEVTIPSLTNWKYYFSIGVSNQENKELVFGIDHKKFEQLKDENGKDLPVENTYHVYNAFIDFHSMSVFSEKTPNGIGVQDLKKIGDKVIHAASYTQPPVNLGSQVAAGSYFKNGEITLTFKGLSIVNEKTCALLEYDSGLSSFYMLMKPMPNMEVPTKGSSHYFGDIYKDLSGGWIQLATLHEFVISETNVPVLNNKINGIIERTINIKNVRKFADE
ncbi:hypothetical protein [Ferruginibacter sp.]|nr:hypothetical protein [Ferruginibacter sp.]